MDIEKARNEFWRAIPDAELDWVKTVVVEHPEALNHPSDGMSRGSPLQEAISIHDAATHRGSEPPQSRDQEKMGKAIEIIKFLVDAGAEMVRSRSMSFHRYLAFRLTSLLVYFSAIGCMNQTNQGSDLRPAERGSNIRVDKPDVPANAPPESQMISLDQIKDDPELISLLNYEFDFNVAIDDDYKNADWFTIEPANPYDVVARDGTGSLFLLFTREQRVIYITSEGQAGVIASNMREAIRMMVALPNWRDLLQFSGGGRIEEMRTSAAFFGPKYLADNPELSKAQAFVKDRLNVVDLEEPIAVLHHAVSERGKGIAIYAKDRSEFQTLFGTDTTAEYRKRWE
jgi:hypothetical protein